MTSGTWLYDLTFKLKRSYIGIPFIDDYLAFLSVVYMPGLNN